MQCIMYTNVNTFCKKTREMFSRSTHSLKNIILQLFSSLILYEILVFCFFITNYRNVCNTHWVSAVLFINQEIIKRQKNYRHISDRMINASLASKQNNSDEIKTMRKYHRWNYSRQRKKNNSIQKCLKKLRESDSLSYSLGKNKKKNRTKSGK